MDDELFNKLQESITQMDEIIKGQDEINVLTGEVLVNGQRQRVFGNIGALADYVKTFNILGGQFGIQTNTGVSRYVLIYNAVN